MLAVLAILLTLAWPRYVSHVDRGKETVLRENLRTVRDAIDRFYDDSGRYPDNIEELVQRRYLRSMPIDPLTERADLWIVIPPLAGEKGMLRDLRSGATGRTLDGVGYSEL